MKQLLSSTNSRFRTQTLKSSPTSCCFCGSTLRNIGKLRAKSYFADHERANTIHGFTDSVPILKIYNCYQDMQTFEQLSISTQAITRQEQCVDAAKQPTSNNFQILQTACNNSNCTIDQLLYYWQTFQPIFVAK